MLILLPQDNKYSHQTCTNNTTCTTCASVSSLPIPQLTLRAVPFSLKELVAGTSAVPKTLLDLAKHCWLLPKHTSKKDVNMHYCKRSTK